MLNWLLDIVWQLEELARTLTQRTLIQRTLTHSSDRRVIEAKKQELRQRINLTSTLSLLGGYAAALGVGLLVGYLAATLLNAREHGVMWIADIIFCSIVALGAVMTRAAGFNYLSAESKRKG